MYMYTHTHTLGAAPVPLTITVCGTLHCEFSQNSSAPDPCCLYAHDKYPPHLLYLQICCMYTIGGGGGIFHHVSDAVAHQQCIFSHFEANCI